MIKNVDTLEDIGMFGAPVTYHHETGFRGIRGTWPGVDEEEARGEARRIYAQLKKWDFGRTIDIIVDHDGGDRSHAEEMVDEYRKYIALVVSNPKDHLAISGAVDPFWHAHIINTRDYLAMCRKLNCGYLHHNPTASQRERTELNPLYEKTMEKYEVAFGTAPQKWWPVTDSVCTNNGCPGCYGYISDDRELVV